MNSIKTKNNRSFRPTKISESLKIINKKVLYKFGKLDYIIHAKWPEIVGVFFMKHSTPEKISSIAYSKDSKGNTFYEKFLHVNVNPAAAVEFQHFQNKIIEKINSFFGYQAIHGIKIHQKFMEQDKSFNKIDETNTDNIIDKKIEIKNTTSKINDKKLKKSLLNLGISISKEK